MESLNQIICEKRLRSKGLISPLQHIPKPTALGLVRANNSCRALVQASLQTVFGRKGRHMTGTFCLTGDTMEGIIQCLVFLKAFSVSYVLKYDHRFIEKSTVHLFAILSIFHLEFWRFISAAFFNFPNFLVISVFPVCRARESLLTFEGKAIKLICRLIKEWKWNKRNKRNKWYKWYKWYKWMEIWNYEILYDSARISGVIFRKFDYIFLSWKLMNESNYAWN